MLSLFMPGLVAFLCKGLAAALESAREWLLASMRALVVYKGRASCEISLTCRTDMQRLRLPFLDCKI